MIQKVSSEFQEEILRVICKSEKPVHIMQLKDLPSISDMI